MDRVEWPIVSTGVRSLLFAIWSLIGNDISHVAAGNGALISCNSIGASHRVSAKGLISPAMKTVRFSDIVKRSGQPESYTLWVAPNKDAEFRRALKAHRVMTVHQETVGTKSDYGTVGFTGDKSASLLIFPKSLTSFEGKRVVGIKYELLKAAPREAPSKQKRSREPRKKPRPKRTKQPQDSNIIPFVREEREESSEQSAAPRKRQGSRVQREIRKVMKALKAGKAVAAYEMLEALESSLSDES